MSPENALRELAGHHDPYLIGVRHHSPVLAAAVPALLAAADPDAVLVELPQELEGSLGWLGHPETTAPVALAVAGPGGERLGFYPFADFSPELAAIRWALAHDVPVHAIDLPAARSIATRPEVAATKDDPGENGGVVPALLRTAGVSDTEELWDRLVESRSYGAEPERLRRAALALGWALRLGAHPAIPARDLAREEWMRRRITEIGAQRPAAVIGSFHAPALAGLLQGPPVQIPDEAGEVVSALIPYSFELLDSRSGYPAGIRDPEWQQAVLTACGDPAAVERAAAICLARVCAELRADGHVAGTPDMAAAYRLATDLAVLRGLPAPGRRELIEALQTALGQGEQLGRARAVAGAAQRALIGVRRGGLAPGTPRSGLVTHVEALLTELGLPGPGTPSREVELRLDPRSPIDLRRHLTMTRLAAAGVAYATPRQVTGVAGVQALTRGWTARWQPATAATLELAGGYGMRLDQAAEGALRTRGRRLSDSGGLTPARRIDLLEQASGCALPDLTRELSAELRGEFVPVAGLPELITAHDLIERITAGHIPGLGPVELPLTPAELAVAAIAAVDGIAGSTDHADAVSLLHLVRLVERTAMDTGRLCWQLRRLTGSGAPLAQGAAGAALLLLGADEAGPLATRLAGWADGHGDDGLAQRLAGVLLVAAPLLEAATELLDPLIRTVQNWSDPAFLARLPALREGFEALSAAARQRFLDQIGDRLGDRADTPLAADPAVLAGWASADLAGREAALAFDTTAAARPPSPDPEPGAEPDPGAPSEPVSDHTISELDRWRLILGKERDKLSAGSCRTARTLDELYGHGHGEGSRAPDTGGAGPRGGGEDPYPTAREWSRELEGLFGARVRDEVLGRAATRGRTDALAELDPERVTPSIELLEQVLLLAGGLPEARLGTLRRLVDRLVAELTRELARRMRPALTGLSTPRPTRRAVGPLDLARTLRANLGTARRGSDGTMTVLPERPIFRTRAKRSADWHVHIVVDVSGSMERSTIYCALVAAVLHGVPALSVRLVTFSTEVIDLTDRVADPLALLLEISVGGGTDIAKGLAYVRERLTVPSRSIIALVTDFCEGGSVGRLLGEVRELAGGGAHLLGLAALDDTGQSVYNKAIAEQVAAAGMPVAALSPTELAAWIGEKVRG